MATSNYILYSTNNISSPNYVAPYNPSWDNTTLQINYNKLINVLNDSANWVVSSNFIFMVLEKKAIEESKKDLATKKVGYESALGSSGTGTGIPDHAPIFDTGTETIEGPKPGAGITDGVKTPESTGLSTGSAAKPASLNQPLGTNPLSKKTWLIAGIVAAGIIVTVIVVRMRK